MIDPIFQTDNYQLARKLLDAAALRQEAIATNIANAETPGFRRLDVAPDFAVQLKARMAAGDFAQSAPSLVLSDDWLGARPMSERLSLTGVARFASEIEADAVVTSDGPVPVANVLAFDAPRTPRV